MVSWSWDGVVYVTATNWELGSMGFESWQGQEGFTSAELPRLALGPTHTVIQWVAGFLP